MRRRRMTNVQMAKLAKIFKIMGGTKDINLDIYLHDQSPETVNRITSELPKGFRIWGNSLNGGNVRYKCWEAYNLYGFDSIEVTVYTKKKGGDK